MRSRMSVCGASFCRRDLTDCKADFSSKALTAGSCYSGGREYAWHDYQCSQDRDTDRCNKPPKAGWLPHVPDEVKLTARWRDEDCLGVYIPGLAVGSRRTGRGMDKEVAVRRAKGLAAYQSFNNVWANKKLQLAHKMRV